MTFKRLVDTLENSDLFVLVEMQPMPLSGHLTFLTATREGRFVRIARRGNEHRDRVIPILGHELQHAVEVASARSITTAALLREFYVECGYNVAATFAHATRSGSKEPRASISRPARAPIDKAVRAKEAVVRNPVGPCLRPLSTPNGS